MTHRRAAVSFIWNMEKRCMPGDTQLLNCLFAPCAVHPVLFLWDWKSHAYCRKHPPLVLKATYSQKKQVIWGTWVSSVGSKFSFSISWLCPSCSSTDFVSLKSKTGMRSRGKEWLNVNVEQCRWLQMGRSHHSAISCWLLSTKDPGWQAERYLAWGGGCCCCCLFCCVPFRARCLSSLWISSGENLSLINNCLCWIYRWTKLFPLMLQFSTFFFSGLHERWHLKEINLSLR